jgi:integrase/recombinase XerD
MTHHRGKESHFHSVPTTKAVVPSGERLLTKSEFQGLRNVAPEIEWFANIENKNTRRAYRNDLKSFMAFVGIEKPKEFRTVTRAHVIA